MKKLLCLSALLTVNAFAADRNYEGVPICLVQINDLNELKRSKAVEAALLKTNPQFLTISPRGAVTCLLTPDMPQLILTLNFSQSPSLNGYSSILTTIILQDARTKNAVFTKSGHKVSRDDGASINTAVIGLFAELLSYLGQFVKE